MKTLQERFDEKWVPVPESGCWLWTASLNSHGYGQIFKGGSPVHAHRVSYELHVGPIPSGMYCLHSCDNRLCVRPDHLFLGTTQDNTADMCEKGRQARGKKQGSSKLTEEQVIAIRADARVQTEIAKEYGVSQKQVSYVKNHRHWSHV